MFGKSILMVIRQVVVGTIGAVITLGAGYAQNAENVVAKLGNVELTITEVRRLLDAQPLETRTQLVSNPQLLDRFVRTEAFKRALIEEARAKGFDRRPEVAEAMERAREQALVTRYMNEQSRPAANYPSEQEVADAYKANVNEFTAPTQYRVSQIYLGTSDSLPRKDAETVKKRIEELAKTVAQKPGDFESIAKKYSEHKASADKGGDLGWVAPDQMVPEVRAIVPELKKGEVSKPVKTSSGWHIVKVVDIKPRSLRPMAEVREYIVRNLRIRKAQENEQKYLDDLIARTPLGVNEIALNRLMAPQVSNAQSPEKKP
jgi:peptidylprolyl isomerase